MNTRLLTTLFIFFLLVPALAFAHGSATHILGTVTESSHDHIVVKTLKGKLVTVTINADTVLQHNGITTKDMRPQVGSRVIAETIKQGDNLLAKELKFSSPKTK